MSRRTQTVKQSGFTLVESLVAMVVLAVGMLGIAGLYIEGLRSGQASVSRTMAVALAADMADRIRANPAATVAYAGAGPGVNNQCVNGPAPCNPAQLAQDDWFWWFQDVQGRLPVGATAAIAVDPVTAAPAVQYDITLTWPEPGQTVPASYNLRFSF
ncbi:MAG: type IV pilus modification protein PilV [Gammaproteobacteria bacterium]|nr:MAG: type IV pilus modification protein PilV [Gammaproteobacteria bacterium]